MTVRDDPIYFDIWRPGEATVLMDVPGTGSVTGATASFGRGSVIWAQLINEAPPIAAKSLWPAAGHHQKPANTSEICGLIPKLGRAGAWSGRSCRECGPGSAGQHPPAAPRARSAGRSDTWEASLLSLYCF